MADRLIRRPSPSTWTVINNFVLCITIYVSPTVVLETGTNQIQFGSFLHLVLYKIRLVIGIGLVKLV